MSYCRAVRVEPIDLRPFRDGSEADRLAVAAAFDHAARTVGFFSITGHGVDSDLIDEMLRVTGAFFDQPVEEKMRYFVDDRSANRGYAPEGSEALAYSLGEQDVPTDLFEAFNVGCELTDAQLADPYYADHRAQYFAPNPWPSTSVDLREIWLAYFAAVDGVANEVMAAAVALGKPGDHFVPYLDKGPTVMRANNYQRRAGAPVALHPPPGRTAARRTRRSVPAPVDRVVQQPNHDAVIECLPTCSDAANPPRYAPVTSGEHLLAKLMGPRLLRPSEQSPRH